MNSTKNSNTSRLPRGIAIFFIDNTKLFSRAQNWDTSLCAPKLGAASRCCDYLTKKIIHTKLNFLKFFTIRKYHIIFSKNCRAKCHCIFYRRFCYSSTSAVTSYPPLKITVISVLLITFTHSISFLMITSSYSVSLPGRLLTVLSASFI